MNSDTCPNLDTSIKHHIKFPSLKVKFKVQIFEMTFLSIIAYFYQLSPFLS